MRRCGCSVGTLRGGGLQLRRQHAFRDTVHLYRCRKHSALRVASVSHRLQVQCQSMPPGRNSGSQGCCCCRPWQVSAISSQHQEHSHACRDTNVSGVFSPTLELQGEPSKVGDIWPGTLKGEYEFARSGSGELGNQSELRMIWVQDEHPGWVL